MDTGEKGKNPRRVKKLNSTCESWDPERKGDSMAGHSKSNKNETEEEIRTKF